MKRSVGFTLIELLIVVAIIGILAAIAIPNFLQAQVRAKVARGQADMNSTMTGLELYRTDQGSYPPMSDLGLNYITGFHSRLPSYLTSPVDYLTALTLDPFVSDTSTWSNSIYPPATQVGKRYAYYNTRMMTDMWGDIWHDLTGWVGETLIYGYGPDKTPFHGANATLLPYDPTNGTVSLGNVIRSQKKSDGIPVHPQTGTYFWP